MKELNIYQMEELKGGRLEDCIVAAGWGLATIGAGVAGGGVAGFIFLALGVSALGSCV